MRIVPAVIITTLVLAAAPGASAQSAPELRAAEAARLATAEWGALALDARQAARASRDTAERDAERQARTRDQREYDQAQRQLDGGQWEAAAQAFAAVAAAKGARADAALYWRAYAQDRAGQRAEALATIADLSSRYPESRYRRQAQALEVEVRSRLGQPVRPEAQADEELKLIAVNALLSQEPEQALPLLEKLLQNPASPRLQERALFVLAQSNDARARQIILGIAKGGSTPDLQQKAIQYLGVQGGPESRAALAELYGSLQDVEARRQVLRAFMIAGEKDRLLSAARGETNPELRVEAVRNLGMMGAEQTGEALVSMYASEKSPEVRRAVIEGLGMQDNATALVALARKEPDPELKKRIVQRLSMMQDKAATEYMLELLDK